MSRLIPELFEKLLVSVNRVSIAFRRMSRLILMEREREMVLALSSLNCLSADESIDTLPYFGAVFKRVCDIFLTADMFADRTRNENCKMTRRNHAFAHLPLDGRRPFSAFSVCRQNTRVNTGLLCWHLPSSRIFSRATRPMG